MKECENNFESLSQRMEQKWSQTILSFFLKANYFFAADERDDDVDNVDSGGSDDDDGGDSDDDDEDNSDAQKNYDHILMVNINARSTFSYPIDICPCDDSCVSLSLYPNSRGMGNHSHELGGWVSCHLFDTLLSLEPPTKDRVIFRFLCLDF